MGRQARLRASRARAAFEFEQGLCEFVCLANRQRALDLRERIALGLQELRRHHAQEVLALVDRVATLVCGLRNNAERLVEADGARVDAVGRPAVAHDNMPRLEQPVGELGQVVETNTLDGDRLEDLKKRAGARGEHAPILQ